MSTYWTLAPSLAQLRKELNQLWPHRDKSSDGSIGDAAHARTQSDHNPDKRGTVRAIDIDRDGIDVSRVLDALKADSRVAYVIYDGYIFNRRHNFAARTYTGVNKHRSHIHVSLLSDINIGATLGATAIINAAKDTRPWLIIPKTPQPPAPSNVLKRGTTGSAVRSLQAGLNRVFPAYSKLAVDGHFGPKTEAVVKEFQRRSGLNADGIVGPKTRAALKSYGITI